MDTNKYSIEPAYDFSDCKSSVVLHQNQIEVILGNNRHVGDGKVCLEFLPRAGIYFYIDLPRNMSHDMFVAMNNDNSHALLFNDQSVQAHCLKRVDNTTARQIETKWCPEAEPVNAIGNASTRMTHVVFHLFNFVDLRGTQRSIKECGNRKYDISHVNMVCDEWKIELKSLPSTHNEIERLKQEGGYGLTHVGLVRKANHTPFSGKEASKCLNALHYFLSFAKGMWCGPVCAVGFDESENRVWELWSSPREPWHEPLSWFDPHNSLQISTLFPGFMRLWDNEDWRGALHEVIYWYLNANTSSRGIDAGIIMTQAALERLAYEHSVKDKRFILREGFNKLWASDNFRMVFSSLHIPLDISDSTPALQGLASSGQKKWSDAPHALTEIRNSIIHPEQKRRDQCESAYYEAWNLGLWYLEMSILAICGYSGTYGNRLKNRWVGQIEDVPWNK